MIGTGILKTSTFTPKRTFKTALILNKCPIGTNGKIELRKKKEREKRQIQKIQGFSGGSKVKNLPANEGDPGSGRSPREGNGYSRRYLYLENPRDTRGAWRVTVHGMAKSQT